MNLGCTSGLYMSCMFVRTTRHFVGFCHRCVEEILVLEFQRQLEGEDGSWLNMNNVNSWDSSVSFAM
jgi:hypothetical protein